jgi:hypothetical protein
MMEMELIQLHQPLYVLEAAVHLEVQVQVMIAATLILLHMLVKQIIIV